MTRRSILIIEDDPSLARLLEQELARDGYDARSARSGTDGLLAAAEAPPDLVLLDLNLPDFDGLEVAERLDGAAPILMLTARTEVDSRVAGLYAGASDYLVKPFSMRELLARVHAMLRDRRPQDARLRHGELELDLAAARCLVGGAAVELTEREFALLALLLDAPGRVFSREELEERLYTPDEQPASNTVEVFVSRLRGKLARAGARDVVRTVRGLGYVVA